MILLERPAFTLIILNILMGGCIQPNIKPVATPTVKSAAPAPLAPSLNLALASPTTVANAQIEQYLSRLGAPIESQGVWMQTQDTLLANHQGTIPLPAASLTKVATSLAILKKLGPDHRFETQISYVGTLQNGQLQGDLVIEGGADPFFVWEDAIALGNLLNQNGIRTIQGNLIIVGAFYMNYESEPVTAGTLLQQGMDYTRWSAATQTQYQTLPAGTPKPQVKIPGKVQTATTLPAQATPLIRHRSIPVAGLLKKMNQYSNNAMAEMLAMQVGGPQAVADIVAAETAMPPQEIQLVNGSGLGIDNRISPRAVCAMFQAIATLLHPHQMTLADIFAITGTDAGVLDDRPLPALAIVKSGTLDRVSALAGALPTQDRGIIWFTLINGKGEVERLRGEQETLLQALLQTWRPVKQPSALLIPSPVGQTNRATSEVIRAFPDPKKGEN